MRILIGTTNPSKARYFERLMEGLNVECVTLRDLGITDEPQETGHTPLENARIKAAFYGKYADAVICADSGLYFDSLLPDDPRQPGLHIRTPQGGKRLDDDEMIAYYAQLVHNLGGKIHAYYMDAMALLIGARCERLRGRTTFAENGERAAVEGIRGDFGRRGGNEDILNPDSAKGIVSDVRQAFGKS